MSETRNIHHVLDLDGVSPTALEVLRFTVREALFETYRAEVTLQCTEMPDVVELLGKDATLRVCFDASTERCFHGVVTGAELDAPDEGQEYFRLRVVVEPTVALLALGRDSRIWLDKSIPDVVKDVLEKAAVPADKTTWDIGTTYEPHVNITQYAESDWDFVSRLLFEEGIGYAVHNDDATETVVFFDDANTLAAIGGPAQTLTARDSVRVGSDVVVDLEVAYGATPDSCMMRDFDPQMPLSPPEADQKLDAGAGREVYLHPGGFTEQAPGQRRVERLLQRLLVTGTTFTSKSDCAFLEPGKTFTVDRHTRPDCNVAMRVLSVVHRGVTERFAAGLDSPAYENEFVAIPADVAYRPASAPEAPRIGGVHVAFITCPSGEEIHTDERGRAKVRFPWDRSGITDDKSSTWLRVGQLALPGSMILPRIDFEVIVDYELGDIDRPYVSLHLYNGDARAPYGLPAGNVTSSWQTATTGGGGGANEVRFGDSAGSEEIFLNASKNYTVSVENDSKVGVGVNETVKVGSNHQLKVGTDWTQNVGGNRAFKVGANQNVNVGTDFAHSTGAADSCTVGAMRKVNAGGDHRENTKVDLTRKIGAVQALVAINGHQRKIGTSANTKVGGAWVNITAQAHALTAKNHFETVGALKMIKAKTIAQTAGAAYTIQCAAHDVKVTGARTDTAGAALSIAAGGGIDVAAANVVISGDSKLVFKAGGCSIEMTPTSITIKASSKVDLRGAKGIANALHKSA